MKTKGSTLSYRVILLFCAWVLCVDSFAAGGGAVAATVVRKAPRDSRSLPPSPPSQQDPLPTINIIDAINITDVKAKAEVNTINHKYLSLTSTLGVTQSQATSQSPHGPGRIILPSDLVGYAQASPKHQQPATELLQRMEQGYHLVNQLQEAGTALQTAEEKDAGRWFSFFRGPSENTKAAEQAYFSKTDEAKAHFQAIQNDAEKLRTKILPVNRPITPHVLNITRDHPLLKHNPPTLEPVFRQ